MATALDATHVYWVAIDSVRRIRKNGGSVETVAANQTSPRTVASDGTTAFWGGYSTTGYVRKTPVAGGNITDVTSVTSPVNDIQLVGTWVYIAEHNIVAGGTSYVRRAPQAGGTAELLASSTQGASELAVVGDCVYFIQPFNSQIIRDCPSVSGPLYTGSSLANGIRAENSGVYFGDSGIKVLPLGGGTATPLSPSGNARSPAIDATHVYYTLQNTPGVMSCGSDWSILKVPKSGGTPVVLVNPPLACPGSLEVDATALYWTNSLSAQVMKVAK